MSAVGLLVVRRQQVLGLAEEHLGPVALDVPGGLDQVEVRRSRRAGRFAPLSAIASRTILWASSPNGSRCCGLAVRVLRSVSWRRPLVERDDPLPGRLDELTRRARSPWPGRPLPRRSAGRPCRSPSGTSGRDRRSRSCRPRAPRAPRRSGSSSSLASSLAGASAGNAGTATSPSTTTSTATSSSGASTSALGRRPELEIRLEIVVVVVVERSPRPTTGASGATRSLRGQPGLLDLRLRPARSAGQDGLDELLVQ